MYPMLRIMLTGVMLVVLAVIAGSAFGDETFCMNCQVERWKNLEDQLLKRAQNLRSTREILRQAEKTRNVDLIREAKALVDKRLAEWEYLDRLARNLNSTTYKTFLARNQVDVEKRYDEARAELHRKTEQFNRLRATSDNIAQKI